MTKTIEKYGFKWTREDESSRVITVEDQDGFSLKIRDITTDQLEIFDTNRLDIDELDKVVSDRTKRREIIEELGIDLETTQIEVNK